MQRSYLTAIATAALLVFGTVASTAKADGLVIGTKLDLNTLDPHFFSSFPTGAAHSYLFDRLIGTDADLNLIPGLIERWEPTEDGEWRIFLRKGVKFHDGSDFEANDVVATFKRIPWVPDTTNSFTKEVRTIVDVKVEDSHTLLLTTSVPTPNLPRNLSNVIVIPSEQVEQSTSDFNNGKVVGTGPYKLVSWNHGDSLHVERFDDYWGGTPKWDKVELRVLSNDGARVAALLAGDVDAIDYTPVEDIDRLRGSDDFNVVSGPLARIHYVAMDSGRIPTPNVAAADGSNPLSDARVRKALSLAINREAIISRLLLGLGEPASQLLPASFSGSVADLAVDPYDPERAKELLAEAGYGQGFKMTFHATNQRYPADVEIAQALAQMWSVIGVDVSVEALARTIFFPKATDHEFSIYIAQYGSDNNLDMATSMLHSWDPDNGRGNGNRARFFDAEVDRLIQTASTELDPAIRENLLVQANSRAMAEQFIIPLFHPAFVVTTREGLTVDIRSNGRLMPEDFSTAN